MLREINLKETAIAIQQWIEQKVAESKTAGVVIGLSGGIDSCLTAALCVEALGPERVHGLILPCFSSEESIVNATAIAEQLEISYGMVSLNAASSSIENAGALDGITDLARANIRSRLRMVALYAQANTMNRLVCGTTNMTEMYLGYFTKYGDGGIDIEPVAGLLKCEVREMARLLLVPEYLVQQTPTADLWAGQTDEDELGYPYDELDAAVLKMSNGEWLDPRDDDVEGEVAGRFKASEHKRTMPPQCVRIIRS